MAVGTALWELQKAIFQRLSSDPSVTGLVTGVFDHVPNDQAFPYIQLGDPNMLPFDTKTSSGEEIAFVIHAWSQYPGKKEAYDILNACLKSITLSPLSIEGGFSIVRVERQQIQVFDDIDGRNKHGVLRLRFYLN